MASLLLISDQVGPVRQRGRRRMGGLAHDILVRGRIHTPRAGRQHRTLAAPPSRVAAGNIRQEDRRDVAMQLRGPEPPASEYGDRASRRFTAFSE